MKYTDWNISQYNIETVHRMAQSGVPLLAAMILSARGVNDPGEALRFINEDERGFRSPFSMPDMRKAVDRILLARERSEKVAIYGDYDVDGITALSILLRCFRENGIDCVGYIPDRIDEGYGLNAEAIEALASEGVTLIVTVDCGITAVEETEFARSLGVDIVITDHHECKERIPDAVAVVNPRRPDCDYPFKLFAGVGVAYKLVCALFGEYATVEMKNALTPLVAIGTIADVMPLLDENRGIVRLGLSCIKNSSTVGLRKLLEMSGLSKKEINSSSIGYILAPRINAAGRLGSARTAVDLLLTDDPEEAALLAEELCNLNRKRQQIENEIYKEACAMLQESGLEKGVPAVLSGEGWHQGVIGIVASRIAEKNCAPAFLISIDGQSGKASCRSYGGFNLFRALEAAGSLLESFGGHALAAGFTIKRENIPEFDRLMRRLFSEYSEGSSVGSVLDIDCEIRDPAILTMKNVEGLCALEPFGSGNSQPVFCLGDAEVESVGDVGGGKHMKLMVSKNGKSYDGIFFGHTSYGEGIAPGDRVDIAFYPVVNEYRNRRSVQLVLAGIRQCAETRRIERDKLTLFQKFRAGEQLTEEEALALFPQREAFVAIWRYLKSHSSNGETRGERTYLSRLIARVAGLPSNVAKMSVCLDVFNELRLIEMREYGTKLHIKLCDTEGRVDLNRSEILKELRKKAGR
ncbi:MAG: single-stranded-DNA-specific exonuclease RecJ [Oscillospiraceae bacterium]|jgi:single-stranded-DNA-specific exonuclease